MYFTSREINSLTGKAHSQLRRLRNESSILKDAVITAIPAHYSKVLFTCTRMTSPLKCVDYYLHHLLDEKDKVNVQRLLNNFPRKLARVISCITFFRNQLEHRRPPRNLPLDAGKTD